MQESSAFNQDPTIQAPKQTSTTVSQQLRSWQTSSNWFPSNRSNAIPSSTSTVPQARRMWALTVENLPSSLRSSGSRSVYRISLTHHRFQSTLIHRSNGTLTFTHLQKVFFLRGIWETYSHIGPSFSDSQVDSTQPFPVSYFRTLMFPVTVVKRFLNRQVPTIPLPRDIEEDITSNAGSWLLISKSSDTPNTAAAACQTSPVQPIFDTKPCQNPRRSF